MHATVVCISRTLAAGGAEVGHLVAEQLGYRYLDDEIITLASEKAQVDPRSLAAVEHHEGIISRILDAIGDLTARRQASPLGLTKEGQPRPAATHKPPALEEGRRLIREVITEIGKRGNAVIVAHAASIPLAGMKGLLRVLITAPDHVRAQRLELDVRILNEQEALKTIQDSDRARLHYLRDFYGIADETPTLYDLLINTETITYESAAAIIVRAARGG